MDEMRGKTPEQIYRLDLTMMTAPGFAGKRSDVIDTAVSLRMQNIQPYHGFLRQSAAAATFDAYARAGSIKQPTLIILGQDDPIFPIALAEDFRKTLPKAKMITYKDCGHAILLEKADQLSGDIREFLKN
jgi:pimeloyl-ACP methyl ester carboxylesterase